MSDDLRLHESVEAYFAARGVDVPVITTGGKAVEEAHELVAALASGDPQQIRNEVADVVIVAALVACQLGVTVGQCIDEKTRRDAGRGEGDHFDGRVLNVGEDQRDVDPPSTGELLARRIEERLSVVLRLLGFHPTTIDEVVTALDLRSLLEGARDE